MRDSFCRPSRGPDLVHRHVGWQLLEHRREFYHARHAARAGRGAPGPSRYFGPRHVEAVARARVARAAHAADRVEPPQVHAPVDHQVVVHVPQQDLADDDGGPAAPDLDDAVEPALHRDRRLGDRGGATFSHGDLASGPTAAISSVP